jgi:hypothetical protein
MKMKMLSAAALAAVAGQASAQPVIDGLLESSQYGSALWVNNQPTTRGNNATLSCDACATMPASSVLTGIEIAIPLSALTKANGSTPSATDFKITAFINGQGHDFVSNMVSGDTASGGLPCPSDNLGEPRGVNFANIAGNQYFTGIGTAGTAPIMNGTLAGDFTRYGAAKMTQKNRTGFGDSNLSLPNQANGSEIDAIYAVVSTIPAVGTTPAAPGLFLLITGNLETNNNKLDIFIDCDSTVGQNELGVDQNTGTPVSNPTSGGGALQRMGYFDDGTNPVIRGMKFDTGFGADYWVSVGNAYDSTAAAYNLYVDYAQLANVSTSNPAGAGYYVGNATAAQATGLLAGGDTGAPVILCSADNSNGLNVNDATKGGVLGTCPPSGGNPDVANGSELDAVYGKIINNDLYLFCTGNLANNFDKLQLFFDAQSGGQNQLLSNNVEIDNGALNRMGSGSGGPGVKFDADFFPDYWLNFGNGNGSTSAVIQFYGNAAHLRTNGAITNGLGSPLDYGAYDGGTKANLPGGTVAGRGRVEFAGPLLQPQTGTAAYVLTNYAPRNASYNLQANPSAPATPNTGYISMAIDNSNLGGITAVDPTSAVTNPPFDVSQAGTVTTGMELRIALAELTDCGQGGTNPPCSSINSVKVAGWLAYGQYGAATISNQVIGGLEASAGYNYARELGEVQAVDFSTIAAHLASGKHYVTVTRAAAACYANCDGSTNTPALTAADFTCFLTKFRNSDPYANCDGSTTTPTLTAADFTCFLQKFRAGCP